MDHRESKELAFATRAITAGRQHGVAGSPMNTPLVMASNYRKGGADNYAREEGTPTWRAFEAALGELEGGEALAFASGMAAVSAALETLPIGARVVAPKDAYSGVLQLLREGDASGRWQASFVDQADTEATVETLPGAAMLWLETPSNPLLEISDLPALLAAARAAGVRTVVDNTFATPALQRPLALGADVVMHSVTKFLSGHSDLLMGALVSADAELAAALRHRRHLGGATPGGLEAFLALRGLRTLPLRLERAQANAAFLALHLAEHEEVSRVRYPGLPSDPGHTRARAQMQGFGAMLSFELEGDAARTDAFCRALRLIEHATSLGGVESSLERRAAYSGQAHVPPTLVRMSVGCEDPYDLVQDLDQALAATRGR